LNRETWLRWLRIYDYPWSNRVWLIQEAILADTIEVAVGRRTFPGWILFGGITYIQYHLYENVLHNIDTSLSCGNPLRKPISVERMNFIGTWQYFK
jgi:hypothetical protein